MNETLEQIALRIAKELDPTADKGCGKSFILSPTGTEEFARRLVAALGAQEPVAWVQNVEREMSPEFAFSWVETRLHDVPLYVAPIVPADWQMVPKEPTEEEIDAPRYVFQALELGLKNIQDIRLHLERCGVDISATPEWFKTGTGHLSKAGKALVVRSLMLAAAPEYKP